MSKQDTTAANDAPMITATKPDEHGLRTAIPGSSQKIAQTPNEVVRGPVGDPVTAPFPGGDQ